MDEDGSEGMKILRIFKIRKYEYLISYSYDGGFGNCNAFGPKEVRQFDISIIRELEKGIADKHNLGRITMLSITQMKKSWAYLDD